MITLGELARFCHFEIMTGEINLEKTVKNGYVSDLLSDVIANIGDDAVWITVQRHINILGVAKLKDVVAIIIPRNLHVEEEILERAKQEGIAMLRDGHTAFEIAGMVYSTLRRGNPV